MFTKPVVLLKNSLDFDNLIGNIRSTADNMKKNGERLALGCDTETTGLSPFASEVRLLQIEFNDVVYILDCFEWPKDKLNDLKSIMESSDIIKIFQNAKFDIKMLKYHFDWNLESIFDTLIASKLIQNGKKGFNKKHSLDDLCEHWLSIYLDKSLQASDWSGHLTEAQVNYAAKDVMVLRPLARALTKEIVKLGLQRVSTIEFKAVLALAMLELHGVYIDVTKWDKVLNDLAVKKLKLEGDLKNHFGNQDINLNSSKQVANAFIELGYGKEITIEDDEGNQKFSTANDIIEPLGKKIPIFSLLCAYREVTKLLGSYGRAEHKSRKGAVSFYEFINPMTGRIHPEFLQNGAASGRLSCSRPNVQQIPTMDKAPFRECFTGQNGNVIIISDYSQIELRILGELSRDPGFMNGFISGGDDFHVTTAAFMFGVPIESIFAGRGSSGEKLWGPNKWMREAAKTINYGLAYGRGPRSLAGQIGCAEVEAKGYISTYFNKYRGVYDWLERAGYMAVRDGYCRTMSGRIRTFEFNRRSRREYSSVTREGKNTPIQGTNADIIKTAYYKVYKWLLNVPQIKLVNTVHDEIVLECPPSLAQEAAFTLKSKMEEAGREFLSLVPVIADVKIGDSWAEK